jgi:tRNA dimethylallyltransferase
LGIDLAKALGGQVINGDSRQLFRGANVITNKVTKDEMQGVKHHLMDFLEPTDTYNVSQFEKAAVETVCYTPQHWERGLMV